MRKINIFLLGSLYKKNELDTKMNDEQTSIQFMKNEKYQDIDSKTTDNTSDVVNKVFHIINDEKRTVPEPKYVKESCKYNSSRIYSERLYFSNFRC